MRWKYVESGEGIERVYQVPVLVLEFLVESGEGIEKLGGSERSEDRHQSTIS